MIRIIIILLLLFYTSAVRSQTKLKGTVSSKTEKIPVAGANVIVKEKTGAILTYTRTDDKGAYQLGFTSTADSLEITISGFSIEKQIQLFANKTQSINFEAGSQSIILKEVKVKPPKIRKLNDTITYSVDGFKDGNDRTIGDVLKKMPGITVKDDGSILYNNKPINKFYIENKDLLQGRYGIATNNIEAKDVATVEVLENHQPVKALKNTEFSDDPALNIKLKADAKGVLTANAQLGAGLSPALWNNELFTMFFNKNRQNMNTYKGNNTGNDPGIDLVSYYTDLNSQKSGPDLAIQSPAVPPISKKRYLFNQAHAFSVNNLWTTGKNDQLTANISYLHDRQDKSSSSSSVYYLPGDSLLTIREQLTSRQTINLFDASLLFNRNNDNDYINNSLVFKGSISQSSGTVTQQGDITQQLNNPVYVLSNTLNLVKNKNKLSFKLKSFNAYSRTPQTLSIQPVLYKELFSENTAAVSMRQSLTRNQFLSSTKLSFAVNSEHWKQNYAAGFNANLQQLDSDLQQQSKNGSLSTPADSLRNNLQWNSYQLFINPDYTYVFKKFRATADLPLSYNYLHTDDGFKPKNINRLFLNPSLAMFYDLNLFLTLRLNAIYKQQLGEISNGFTGYIMQSYRSLVKNDGQLPEQQNQNYSLNMSYRHPIQAVFADVSAGYFRNRSSLLYSYDYQGILSVQKTYDIPTITTGRYLNGRVTKGIDAVNGNISLDAGFNSSTSSQLSQNQLVDFRTETYYIKPEVLTKIGKTASVSYTFQFARSKSIILNDSRPMEPLRANTQRVKLSLFPAKKLVINLEHEYFYSSAATAGNRAMNFANASLKYTYKKIEYNMEYNNIFNTKQYVFANYNEISSYYAVYDLRPAQLLLKIRFKIK